MRTAPAAATPAAAARTVAMVSSVFGDDVYLHVKMLTCREHASMHLLIFA